MLYLETLGRIRLTTGTDRRPLPVPRLSLWLLAFLTLSRGRMHATEAIMEQFWPDCDPARGRSNLSSALWRLRRVLPEESPRLLASDVPGALGLVSDAPLWFDAEAFADDLGSGLAAVTPRFEAPEARRFERALAFHAGELLAGCSLDWVLLERERLLLLWVRAQLRWIEHCSAGAEWEAALAAGAAVLRHDPLRESLHRRMIELHLANGNPCAARRQFEACVRILDRELGIPPDPATWAAIAPLQEAAVPVRRVTSSAVARRFASATGC
jgi:DNA-binding SARP family transcriptional activator